MSPVHHVGIFQSYRELYFYLLPEAEVYKQGMSVCLCVCVCVCVRLQMKALRDYVWENPTHSLWTTKIMSILTLRNFLMDPALGLSFFKSQNFRQRGDSRSIFF